VRLSPVGRVLVERSLLGWKEYELEVMRDGADNVIIVCTIENFDPMGVHTGDSITVAPSMTLTDREYQNLRELALRAIRRVGVATGGANVQFAVNPVNGDVVCIEINPRVSRSSALASKATGFPIAKIAAQLAVGLTLDGIQNDITRVTPACFEPVLDYVIVKIPRWNFEKFGANVDTRLGSAMRAVGEVMGIGRTFSEALLKAIDSLEGGWPVTSGWSEVVLRNKLEVATPDRLAAVFEAMRRGWALQRVFDATFIDPWFLDQIERLVAMERELRGLRVGEIDAALLEKVKRAGFSDARIAALIGAGHKDVLARRDALGLERVYRRVDTCAAEFESHTPYLYSTFEDEDESGESPTDRVIILGNGPNRIGQGLEFDYACCHAAFAIQEAGLTAVMVNCNPETVSTDYDTSDKLYFEPCTEEHVRSIVRREKPRGVILQFGGQTPLKMAHDIDAPILGTSPDAIDVAEDRERFAALLHRLRIRQPQGAVARDAGEARVVARRLGYPLLVRPSYVLGGRSMNICYDDTDLDLALADAVYTGGDKPILIDRFLDGAIEYDVDALADGRDVYIGGIIEHIEEAGVHSGDSFGVIPPRRLSADDHERIVTMTRQLALELGVVGVLNLQLAIHEGQIYVIEVNPRASRTVPFVAKATGVPLAKLATRLALGSTLAELHPVPARRDGLFFVKGPVFPWQKLPGSSGVLGPEMRSTGEVMGVGTTLGEAYAKHVRCREVRGGGAGHQEVRALVEGAGDVAVQGLGPGDRVADELVVAVPHHALVLGPRPGAVGREQLAVDVLPWARRAWVGQRGGEARPVEGPLGERRPRELGQGGQHVHHVHQRLRPPGCGEGPGHHERHPHPAVEQRPLVARGRERRADEVPVGAVVADHHERGPLPALRVHGAEQPAELVVGRLRGGALQRPVRRGFVDGGGDELGRRDVQRHVGGVERQHQQRWARHGRQDLERVVHLPGGRVRRHGRQPVHRRPLPPEVIAPVARVDRLTDVPERPAEVDEPELTGVGPG
jgi:carbamoyl-phosphate synthase large subunit